MAAILLWRQAVAAHREDRGLSWPKARRQAQGTVAVLVLFAGHAGVSELVQAAFGHVGLDWRKYVVNDPRYMRPAEVDLLQADPAKAVRELNWSPTVNFRELVAMMVDADLVRLRERR